MGPVGVEWEWVDLSHDIGCRFESELLVIEPGQEKKFSPLRFKQHCHPLPTPTANVGNPPAQTQSIRHVVTFGPSDRS